MNAKIIIAGICNKIYFIKPMIGVSKSRFLGALPGILSQKSAPFLESFKDVAYSLGMEQQLERYLHPYGLKAQSKIL